MKKLWIILAFGLNSIFAQAEMVYLGGAYNAYHCSQIAGSYGFPRYQFGGYWGGYYIWNGCFGLGNNNPPPPAADCKPSQIYNSSWAVKTFAAQVKLFMKLSEFKAIYSPAESFIKDLEDAAQELEELAKDKSSCRLMERYFLDYLRPAFNEAKTQFLDAHHKALDPKVGEAWERVEKEYRTLRSQVR
ncbi:MAG: hypothetical protein ACKOA8_17545 [Deltaproteobacteria bacterium]|jgi:hypothetical protein